VDSEVAAVAALFADETRAAAIGVLMSGRAHTAGELARAAAVSPSTMTSHLRRLLDAGAVAQEAQGRHRYYRLADERLAGVFEALSVAAPPRPVRSPAQSRQALQLRRARTCYDHLAGQLGVAITAALVGAGWLVAAGADYDVTDAGAATLVGIGVDVAACRDRRRRFAFPCLDWTERTHHLAGAVGAALLDTAIESGWVRRRPDSRALTVTPPGARALAGHFGVSLDLSE
jgi:DNA-binding transcriptional ArsR family regulator